MSTALVTGRATSAMHTSAASVIEAGRPSRLRLAWAAAITGSRWEPAR